MIWIWIIIGYDFNNEMEDEIVTSYTSEKMAKEHLSRLKEESKRNRRRTYKKMNPWDHNRNSNDFTDYYMMKVPLVRHLDEYLENIEEIKKETIP